MVTTDGGIPVDVVSPKKDEIVRFRRKSTELDTSSSTTIDRSKDNCAFAEDTWSSGTIGRPSDGVSHSKSPIDAMYIIKYSILSNATTFDFWGGG